MVHFQGRVTCEKAMISKNEDFRCMLTQMRTMVLVYKNLLNCVILFRANAGFYIPAPWSIPACFVGKHTEMAEYEV